LHDGEGIEVHAPVKDALLVGSPAGDIEDIVAAMQQSMAEASDLGKLLMGRIPLDHDRLIVPVDVIPVQRQDLTYSQAQASIHKHHNV